MRNCTEAFVPHPEEEEKKEYHSCSKGDDDVLQREEKYLSHGEIYAFPGPLMRANMQKDELMKFIQQKCQECLLHLDDPQQQKSYFFWTIMEHFHKKNGDLRIHLPPAAVMEKQMFAAGVFGIISGDDDVLQREEKYLSHGEIYAFPGPLMRANMQKDELMKFIQQKCQECLLHLDDPQQQKSYFFWTIMEHFHKKNGDLRIHLPPAAVMEKQMFAAGVFGIISGGQI
ncbi:hypothetical protein KOW79_020307 [Hemibagrus wyckioides]|uniref:Uncharacterized protein n=1 Tax=Hemibagrus wyckioides TaxID=337641 RepID=A0A9D3N528_9TELE|nr:hypothetical protein KOW79_020307 [Hemibagrus wyckioides]